MGYKDARLRRLNDARTAAGGDYVLYWMQAYRGSTTTMPSTTPSPCAAELGRPLVVYEGLRLDYPWAARRLHRFILEGMQANAGGAKASGLDYWPYVETPRAGPRTAPSLAARACLVVTDDFPCFIVPGQSAALARRVDVPVFAVDSNSLVPLSSSGLRCRPPPPAAANPQGVRRGLGPSRRARPRPDGRAKPVDGALRDLAGRGRRGAFLDGLPLDAAVPPVATRPAERPRRSARLSSS